MGLIDAWFEGYISSTLLARELGLSHRDFRHTSMEKIKFKKTLLVKIPKEAVPFVRDGVSVLIREDDEREFDYILRISKTKRVGFWL